MFSSLRVRLPLLFLAGIVLAGIVTGLIALQLFRDFARNQTLRELRRESKGIAQLYSSAVAAERSHSAAVTRFQFSRCVSACKSGRLQPLTLACEAPVTAK